MKIKSIIFAATIVFGNSYAADEWLKIESSDAGVWEGRAGTREFATTKGGVRIVVLNGRIRWTKEKSVDFVRWYVSVEDCKQGYGKVVSLDMAGNFKFENDFVLKGGSVASSLGETLCYAVEQERLKGI